MSKPSPQDAPASGIGPEAVPAADPPAPARADLHDAIGWVVLGAAIVIASWRMDRLAAQNVNPLTVPGLVPGLLGIGMVIVGVIMGLRSWERGALVQAIAPMTPNQRQRRKRALLATLLCCGYSLVLIGHGLPFWLASTIYVTGSILVFDRISSDPVKRQINVHAIVKALIIGGLSSVVVWLVFERLFLVRLP